MPFSSSFPRMTQILPSAYTPSTLTPFDDVSPETAPTTPTPRSPPTIISLNKITIS